MQAIWNGQVIAQSENTIEIEGNHYFPPESINQHFFSPSEERSVCPWKGEASYYTLAVNGEHNLHAAWFYPKPYAKAAHIKNYVAFWNGVEVRTSED